MHTTSKALTIHPVRTSKKYQSDPNAITSWTDTAVTLHTTNQHAILAVLWRTGRAKGEALALAPAVEPAVSDDVMPAISLDLVARKTTRAAQRHTLRERAGA